MLNSTSPRKTTKKIGNDPATANESDPRATTIDLAAPAGSEKSLGAESVRDDRPATCDDVVEAIDEEDPGITAALAAAKLGDG
jgi:hypothetical protein